MKPRCNNGKKGMTLVEVVVSMGIVAIVTVAAVTLLVSSVSNMEKTRFKNDARYFAADAVECFRIAANATDFENLLEFRGGYSAKSGTEYMLSDSGYKATVAVIADSGLATLSVTIEDQNGSPVIEQTFVKAVTAW